jgi:hypothetical protein
VVSNPLSDFRQLSTKEMHDKLKELAEAIDGNLEPELESFAKGLVAHMLTCTDRTFTFVEKMEKVVSGLPQSNDAKEVLLAELADYIFAAPNQKEGIRNRIHAAIVARPAPQEKPKKQKSYDANGRNFPFPEGWNE